MTALFRLALLAALTLAAVLTASPSARAAESGVVPIFGQSVDGPATTQDLGAGWVRLFVDWKLTEPVEGDYEEFYVDQFKNNVAAYRARGIKVLAVVTATPPWASASGSPIGAPSDPSDYTRFIGHMMDAAPGVEAWEIWNEADDNVFWESGPQPDAYARLLKASYAAIKAKNPSATVVTSGMVGANADFVEALYVNGAGGSFDAVGVHTDFDCLVETPDEFYREPTGRIGRFTFTGYREVHAVMSDHGDAAKPIWLTEIGWNTINAAPNSCPAGTKAGQKAEGVTEEAQAKNLTRAYDCIANDPFVAVAFWFSLQDIPDNFPEKQRFGLIRQDGSRKPSYEAMKKVANGSGAAADPACGGVVDRTPPELTVDPALENLVFSRKFDVSATAKDVAGGAGMYRIQLLLNGEHVQYQEGETFTLKPFHESGKLPVGSHTVTLRAIDLAKNRTERTLTVTKVAPGDMPEVATTTALKTKVKNKKKRKVRVSGAVVPGPSTLPIGGRVRVLFKHRERSPGGKRMIWKRYFVKQFDVKKPWAKTVKLPKKGKWRIEARYGGSPPFAASNARPVTVKVG